MKNSSLFSVSKKIHIALAVMVACGITCVSVGNALASNTIQGTGNTIATGDNHTLIGNTNMALNGDNTTHIGSANQSMASDGIAVGSNNFLNGQYTVSVGHYTKATGESTIVIGNHAEANFESSIAIGVNSIANAINSVAVGAASQANEANTFSVGSIDNLRKIVNVGYGKSSNDAATFGQVLKKDTYNIKLGSDGKGGVTLNDAAGPTINVDASAIIDAGSAPAFDGSNLNQAIKDADVDGGYTATANNSNTATQGTVVGAINSAYQAGKDYTDQQLENKVGTLTADGTYIKKDNNVSKNLVALDEALAGKADKDLSNITDQGKEVIKELAGEKAGEIVTEKLGEITSTNYVKKDAKVNENISTLDAQIKINADAIEKVDTKAETNKTNIGEVNKLQQAGMAADNLTDGILEVNKKAEQNTTNIATNKTNIGDVNKLKDAGLKSENLSDGVVEVNKKADENKLAIDNVNNRVDMLGNRVDRLNSKVNKVGAGAAALAALHPMDFDADNKLTFAAGYGNYGGENAAAIGAFYRPDEHVMFSLAGNMGNGENMINAGISFALDRTQNHSTSKVVMAKKLAEQEQMIAEQNEKIAKLEAMIQQLAAQIK